MLSMLGHVTEFASRSARMIIKQDISISVLEIVAFLHM